MKQFLLSFIKFFIAVLLFFIITGILGYILHIPFERAIILSLIAEIAFIRTELNELDRKIERDG